MKDHISEDNLLLEVRKATELVKIGGYYTHYRDPKTRYHVVSICIVEATQEPGVLYMKDGPPKPLVWMRPLKSWLEKVKLDNGKVVNRFELVS